MKAPLGSKMGDEESEGYLEKLVQNVETALNDLAKEDERFRRVAHRVGKVSVVYEGENTICRIEAQAPQDDAEFLLMTSILFDLVAIIGQDAKVGRCVDKVEILYDEGHRSTLCASIEDINARLRGKISFEELWLERINIQTPE
jgi:hypothetical protein